jgi:uncharacterized membrane protein YhaH (DUF805 family)
MRMTTLLFNDEGVIDRRQWRIGTLVLLALYMTSGAVATRWLGASRLDQPFMLFCSIAILIPFHAVNAKRFRAIGRSPALALWGGSVPALSILVSAFAAFPLVDIALGWMLVCIVVWYVVDLGIYPHDAKASHHRIDAVTQRA